MTLIYYPNFIAIRGSATILIWKIILRQRCFYSKGIDLNPDSKDAFINRKIMLWKEEEYEKALKDAKKIYELDKDNKKN